MYFFFVVNSNCLVSIALSQRFLLPTFLSNSRFVLVVFSCSNSPRSPKSDETKCPFLINKLLKTYYLQSIIQLLLCIHSLKVELIEQVKLFNSDFL